MLRRGLKRKTVLGIGGIILFFAGVLIGSFLVLKSGFIEGKLYSIENDGTVIYTQELLGELQSVQDLSPDDFNIEDPENLTAGFFNAVAVGAAELGVDTEEEFLSDDFILNVVIPYFEENRPQVFPQIDEEKINTSPIADKSAYLEEVFVQTILITGAWQEVVLLEPSSLESPEVIKKFKNISSLLGSNDEELWKKEVPKEREYIELHKKVLKLSAAFRRIVDETILNQKEDPIRAILVYDNIDEAEQLGREVMAEISRLSKISK